MLGFGLDLDYGGPGREAKDYLVGIHNFGGKGLANLVVLHIAAALKHYIPDTDPTLSRMLRGKCGSDAIHARPTEASRTVLTTS